jgi:hypothetical protein
MSLTTSIFVAGRGARCCGGQNRPGAYFIPVPPEANDGCRGSAEADFPARYPRLSERNPLTGRIAPIDNRYRVSRRLGAQGPAGKGCERHEDVRRVDAGDVVPVIIRLGNEDLIGRAEEKGRELPQDTVIEPQPEIPEIAGVMDAVVRKYCGLFSSIWTTG